jgi:hypothetical protein
MKTIEKKGPPNCARRPFFRCPTYQYGQALSDM